jgi:hypothetical protein
MNEPDAWLVDLASNNCYVNAQDLFRLRGLGTPTWVTAITS